MNIANVAYQGIDGSFSFLAMQAYFKGQVNGLGQKNFRDIFTTLISQKADYSIVPIENSLAGSVYDIYDLLLEYNCFITGEHYHRVNHALLVSDATQNLSEVKKVFSHPKALEQCQNFFNSNPNIEKIFYSDTASAAKHVADNKDKNLAAIASKEAAKLYGLKALQGNIEDNTHNFTRFLILSNNSSVSPDANKGSLIFSLPHTPQSLLRSLEIISHEKINISKIQSRPIHGKPFEYVFYVDFDFDNKDLSFVKERLETFKSKVNFFKNLGLYPKSSLK